ncbi:MAG: hypothetical protein WB766_14005 [Roseiarcus sp.]
MPFAVDVIVACAAVRTALFAAALDGPLLLAVVVTHPGASGDLRGETKTLNCPDGGSRGARV